MKVEIAEARKIKPLCMRVNPISLDNQLPMDITPEHRKMKSGSSVIKLTCFLRMKINEKFNIASIVNIMAKSIMTQ